METLTALVISAAAALGGAWYDSVPQAQYDQMRIDWNGGAGLDTGSGLGFVHDAPKFWFSDVDPDVPKLWDAAGNRIQ